MITLSTKQTEELDGEFWPSVGYYKRLIQLLEQIEQNTRKV